MVAIFICFIFILILTYIICQHIGYYNSLRKSSWADSPILYTILFAISFTFFTIGIFIKFKDNIESIPLYFIIFLFEFLWFVLLYSRMFSNSKIFAFLIFILTGFEIVFMIKSNSPELCWVASPFLFFTLIQIAISEDLSKYNIDYEDLINFH